MIKDNFFFFLIRIQCITFHTYNLLTGYLKGIGKGLRKVRDLSLNLPVVYFEKNEYPNDI